MRMSGYSFDVEVLLMAQRFGYRVAEVPVNWTHQPGSKVRVLRDGLIMARDVLRIRANAFRGLYEEPHIARAAKALSGPEVAAAFRARDAERQLTKVSL